jgi:hypothetical protein
MLCLLVIEGCGFCTLACVMMWRLLKEVSKTRYALFGVFMGVPAGFVRALAVKQIVIDEDDDGDSDSEFGDDLPADQKAAANAEANTAASAGAAAASVAARPTNAMGRRAGPSGFVVEVQGGDGYGSAGLPNVPAKSGFHPLRGLLEGARKMLTRSDSRSSMGDGDASGGRRRLSRNARDVLLLLVPFLAWGVALIAIYAVSYQELSSMASPLCELNIINYTIYGITRCIYFAQELSLAAAGDQAGWKVKLADALEHLTTEYNGLLYGPSAVGARGTEPHFVHATGAAFRDRSLTELFFPESDEPICYRCAALHLARSPAPARLMAPHTSRALDAQ